MKDRLKDIISFRADRLFDGAVDVDWFLHDKAKANLVAESFVFHGPAYHGVSQRDVGTEHGHRLIDSATFVHNILRRCSGSDDQPFTLAIAGYGTGKSHLAMTLAILLSEPAGESAEEILTNLESADESVGKNVRQAIKELRGPALVVSLNGMGNFDLANEFTRQIMHQLHANNVDASALDDLRPRFKMSANLVQIMPDEESSSLAGQFGFESKADLIEKLEQHDESVYEQVYKYFAAKGIPIKAIGDETVKDVLETVCREYCGEDKPYSRVVVLFDEFGRYAEFATVRSQVAGSGVLQHLFEGVQSNSSRATFVGFIQFDLNTYVQRMAQEFKNEILRVSTRYQSSDKAYLSINLETLIANLLEKKNHEALSRHFDQDACVRESINISQKLRSWFPKAGNHHLWCDAGLFHRIIRKGCWPLSPYAAWFLYHLAAAGQHLQQRSALALLGDAFERNKDRELENLSWEMAAVDLWSDSLQTELLAAEESGSLGTVTHSYSNVMSRSGHHFSPEERRLLQAVVLASKMGLSVTNRDDATMALGQLSGVPGLLVEDLVKKLENEYNVISWDDSFKQFEILGDAVSRPQFLSFLRQRVNKTYDERGKTQLFVRRASEWGAGLLTDQVCDFAEQHRITTTEWRFEHAITNLDELPQCVTIAAQNWEMAYAVDASRGNVIFCYVEPSRDLEKTRDAAAKFLRDKSRQFGIKALPILIVLLIDNEGSLGQHMAELAVLDEDLDEQDKVRFGNLVGAHRQKCLNLFLVKLEAMIKDRHYVTAFPTPLEAKRLNPVCSEIFQRIYPRALCFPFDGFSTARGNAADSCMALTSELLNGVLDYQTVTGKPIKEKNRALEVLNNSWKVFTKKGDVTRRPTYDVARAILQEWEDQLTREGDSLSLGEAIRRICKPPFGANLASAGLLLGVFIRARKDDFSVLVDGQTTDFSRIVSDGLFRGKFLDLNKLERICLVHADKEGGSEWDAILDDLERASNVSYKELIEAYLRSLDLKNKLPLPSSQIYRYEHLEARAREAFEISDRFRQEGEDGSSRLDNGMRRNDVRLMTFGAALLKGLQDRMRDDPMWDSESCMEFDREIEMARQCAIQVFDDWLSRQSPEGRGIRDASNFERKMLQETGKNLTKLGLNQLFEKLKKHVETCIRDINNHAEAHELISKVSMWVGEHESMRLERIAELRQLKDTAKEYGQKIVGASRKTSLPELDTVKHNLNDFVEGIRKHEKEIEKRANRLWDIHFSVEDMEHLAQEVEDLERIYEGCESDLDDLRLMRRSLSFFRDAFRQLSSEHLSETEFDELSDILKQRGCQELSEEEPPWMPEDAILSIIQHVRREKETQGEHWLSAIEPMTNVMDVMDASEANTLFNKLSNPPAFLNNLQKKKAVELLAKIEQRLSRIKVEWLVAKYNELEESSRKEFLKQIGVARQQ